MVFLVRTIARPTGAYDVLHAPSGVGGGDPVVEPARGVESRLAREGKGERIGGDFRRREQFSPSIRARLSLA